MSWTGDSNTIPAIALIGGFIFVAVAGFGLWVNANYDGLRSDTRAEVQAEQQERLRQQEAERQLALQQRRTACEQTLNQYLQCNPLTGLTPLMPRSARLETLLGRLGEFQTQCGDVVRAPLETEIYAYCGIEAPGSDTVPEEYKPPQSLVPPPAPGPRYEEPPRPEARLITSPIWARRPDPAQIRDEYPEQARRSRQGGRVMLACTAESDGRLQCVVEGEEPPDLGFGNAALRIMRSARLERHDRTGQPVRGRVVRVPIVFRYED